MSVYVALLTTTVPPHLSEEAERTRSHEDRLQGDAPVEYQYSVHQSGALVVWRCPHGAQPEVETVYGPAAWETVDGATHRTP